MTLQLALEHLSAQHSPLLVVFALDAAPALDREQRTAVTLLTEDTAVQRACSAALQLGDFRAARGESLVLYSPAGVAAERLLVVGLGPVAKLDVTAVRDGAGAAIRHAKDKGVRSLCIAAPEFTGDVSDAVTASLPSAEVLRAIAEGASLGDFDADIYKTDRKDRTVHAVTVLSRDVSSSQEGLQAAFEQGRLVAESQNWARSLVLEPGNILTPTELGIRASAMAQEMGLACTVHSTEFLQQQNMGAFLAVARGSAEAPALIELHYEPAEPPAPGSPVIALVGKGITFDTGGISIKPADGMDKMKYDMAGAAAMLGAMRAIALLRPKVRVLCIVCAAENMPSGTAYKPGDVVTAMSGKTIEVMNTDAEGRMVLADGLHYARTLGATLLIDAATLTGACVVALGKRNAGLFSNDDTAADRFAAAARLQGECFWRMPCTDDYRDLIKSQIADIQNTGVDRWGGAITAAMFLKDFVGDTPWIHLDIAGVAWVDDAKGHFAKGPSGVAVRSIAAWVGAYGAS